MENEKDLQLVINCNHINFRELSKSLYVLAQLFMSVPVGKKSDHMTVINGEHIPHEIVDAAFRLFAGEEVVYARIFSSCKTYSHKFPDRFDVPVICNMDYTDWVRRMDSKVEVKSSVYDSFMEAFFTRENVNGEEEG